MKTIGIKNIIRWVALIALLVTVNLGIGVLLTRYAAPLSGQESMLFGLVVFSLLLFYVILLAIPFVPGVEIGLSLMIVHGAAAAPFVHGATVLGLLLAYGVGLAFSDRFSCKFLSTMGLVKACAYVEGLKGMDREQRITTLQSSMPPWAGKWAINHRYLMLALALNVPGNAFIGGGGGISLVAGLSRLYSPSALIITIILATAPVPVMFYIFGSSIIN